jgi:hypothetical protein
VEIRSYRRVFALERRIYRIDRLRLNPSGLPVRGVVYFLVLLAATVILARLPLLEIPAALLPWYLRHLALPAALAAVLTIISVDGRPFHLAAQALLRHWTRPVLASAGTQAGGLGRRSQRWAGSEFQADFIPRHRWHPEPIVLLPDGSDARMRRLRYTGPGAVLVAVEHERAGRSSEQGAVGLGRVGRRPALILNELPGNRALSRGTVIALASGARLLVKPERKVDRATEHSRDRAREHSSQPEVPGDEDSASEGLRW